MWRSMCDDGAMKDVWWNSSGVIRNDLELRIMYNLKLRAHFMTLVALDVGGSVFLVFFNCMLFLYVSTYKYYIFKLNIF